MVRRELIQVFSLPFLLYLFFLDSTLLFFRLLDTVQELKSDLLFRLILLILLFFHFLVSLLQLLPLIYQLLLKPLILFFLLPHLFHLLIFPLLHLKPQIIHQTPLFSLLIIELLRVDFHIPSTATPLHFV